MPPMTCSEADTWWTSVTGTVGGPHERELEPQPIERDDAQWQFHCLIADLARQAIEAVRRPAQRPQQAMSQLSP